MNDQDKAILETLVSLIIPPSAEYQLPGANDPQIFTSIVTLCEQQVDFASEHLSTLEQTAQTKLGQSFVELEKERQMGLIDTLGRDSSFSLSSSRQPYSVTTRAIVSCNPSIWNPDRLSLKAMTWNKETGRCWSQFKPGCLPRADTSIPL